jgi:uncharacterized pyridoxamine 5'-phosphate oxidase family protein
MGSKVSKHKHKHKIITDYSKVSIPNNYVIIKISSYNVNITNTVSLSNKIKNILIFIVSKFKEKDNDVICLQGVYDSVATMELVSEIRKYIVEYNVNFYFAPEFDNIIYNSNSNKISITRSKHSHVSKLNHINNTQNIEFQNIIISKYPIVSSIYGTLSNNLNEIVTNTKTVIGANITVNNNLISIYCVELSANVETANIDNRYVRQKELYKLNDIIQNNITNINNISFDIFRKTDIHLIAGTFHINDINNMSNEEYHETLQNYKFVDIFRCLHDYTIHGHTDISNKRIDYIFIYLTDDMYDEKSDYFNKIQKIETASELLKLLFERYKIHFIESYVRTDVSHNFSSPNFPIETVIMVKYMDSMHK